MCKLQQPKVVYIVVGHIQVNQALVLGNCLGKRLGAVICTLVVGEVQRFERAVILAEILCNRFTALESNLVCIQVEHL